MKLDPMLRIGLLIYGILMFSKHIFPLPHFVQGLFTGLALALLLCGAFAPRLRALKAKLFRKN